MENTKDGNLTPMQRVWQRRRTRSGRWEGKAPVALPNFDDGCGSLPTGLEGQ